MIALPRRINVASKVDGRARPGQCFQKSLKRKRDCQKRQETDLSAYHDRWVATATVEETEEDVLASISLDYEEEVSFVVSCPIFYSSSSEMRCV